MVLESVQFAGIELAIAPGRVMSPRPASAALVEHAVAWLGDRPARVVDVGTGSGAVAVALALRAPAAAIWATDLDPAAVVLTRLNARLHGVEERVHVRRGDLLEPTQGRFAAIVANLPYLPRSERSRYPDLGREPAHAVFAAGDGLGPYRRLLAEAGRRLLPGGLLLVQLHARVYALAAASLAA